jgi:hypothetical protein
MIEAQKCCCGSSARILHWDSYWKVKCERHPDGCEYEGHTMRTRRDAIREWDALRLRQGIGRAGHALGSTGGDSFQ